MTILVGLPPNDGAVAPLRLAMMVAASIDEGVEALTVLPAPWPPQTHLADAEFLAVQESIARQNQDRVGNQIARMTDDVSVPTTFTVAGARSVASGLLEAAARPTITSVVLGSSAAVLAGRIGIASVAERILHSCGVPIYLSPHDYGGDSGARIRRVTAGFGRTDAGTDLLAAAQALASRARADLRVASFAVRPVNALAGSIEPKAEELVVDEWARQLQPQIERAVSAVVGVGERDTATRVETVLGRGTSWAEALADISWYDGDLLAVGSSASAFSSLFLGSHAAKIVRHSPVPVVRLPRSTYSS